MVIHRALAIVLPLLVGCGASGPSPAGSPAQPSGTEAQADSPKPLAGARKRLQGTWEIARYESDHPIPKEAMPIMGELFDSLRLRFDGAKVVTKAGKATEESGAFDVADERGDEFRMVAKGGMFDGATCKFLGDDAWEVHDRGTAWPGLTVLRRAK